MPLVNQKEIKDLVETSDGKTRYQKVQTAASKLVESLKKGELKGEDFSIRQLASNFVVDRDGNPMGDYLMSNFSEQNRFEAGSNLTEHNANIASLDGFSQINGQILYSKVREAMELAELSVHRLFGVIPSTFSIDRPEQFAGVSNIGDQSIEVEDGQTFATAGPTQIFTSSPRQKVRGLMTGCTWAEAAADRTGQILMRMDSVAQSLALRREKHSIDLVIDAANSIGQRYNYKKVVYGTYDAVGTDYGSPNSVVSPLVDAFSLNKLYKSMAKMTDPETGEPITSVGDWTLLVTPENAFTAKRISVQTQLRSGTAAANDTIMITGEGAGSSPTPFNVVVSKYLPFRLDADGSRNEGEWYFGNFREAFKYVRAADLTVQQAVPLTGTLFSNNLVGLWRAWWCEECFVWEPRNIGKATPS